MEKDYIPFKVRLPRALHAQLAELAQREFRSLHGQILHILDGHTGPVLSDPRPGACK